MKIEMMMSHTHQWLAQAKASTPNTKMQMLTTSHTPASSFRSLLSPAQCRKFTLLVLSTSAQLALASSATMFPTSLVSNAQQLNTRLTSSPKVNSSAKTLPKIAPSKFIRQLMLDRKIGGSPLPNDEMYSKLHKLPQSVCIQHGFST